MLTTGSIIPLGHMNNGKSTIAWIIEKRAPQTNVKQQQKKIIDAPGLKQYITKVLSKIIWPDIAIVVVSAKENQFNATFHEGQLKEHVLLCKGFGIVKSFTSIQK